MTSKGPTSSKSKKEIPQDLTIVPAGIDTSTFFTPIIPESVIMTVPLLHAITVSDALSLVNIAIELYLSENQLQSISSVNSGIVKPDILKHINDTDYGSIQYSLMDLIEIIFLKCRCIDQWIVLHY